MATHEERHEWNELLDLVSTVVSRLQVLDDSSYAVRLARAHALALHDQLEVLARSSQVKPHPEKGLTPAGDGCGRWFKRFSEHR